MKLVLFVMVLGENFLRGGLTLPYRLVDSCSGTSANLSNTSPPFILPGDPGNPVLGMSFPVFD